MVRCYTLISSIIDVISLCFLVDHIYMMMPFEITSCFTMMVIEYLEISSNFVYILDLILWIFTLFFLFYALCKHE